MYQECNVKEEALFVESLNHLAVTFRQQYKLCASSAPCWRRYWKERFSAVNKLRKRVRTRGLQWESLV
jgi:hypothetical protein